MRSLSEKGVHEVSARRFCLVAADHPLVSAISENAERLQLGEVAMMPEGLVKISSGLYDTVMPMVKAQVTTQIKVRDFSEAAVTIAPADFSSWTAVRDAMLSEQKAALKAKVRRACDTAPTPTGSTFHLCLRVQLTLTLTLSLIHI